MADAAAAADATDVVDAAPSRCPRDRQPTRIELVRYAVGSGFTASGAAIVASWDVSGVAGAIVWCVVAVTVALVAGWWADSLIIIVRRPRKNPHPHPAPQRQPPSTRTMSGPR